MENGVNRSDMKPAQALEALLTLTGAFRTGQVERAAVDKVETTLSPR